MASAQSTSSPFIQIFAVSCITFLRSGRSGVGGFQHNVLHPAARRSHELDGWHGDHVPVGAAARPDGSVPEQRPLDEHDIDALEREQCHRPGSNPVAATTSSGLRHARLPGVDESRDLSRVGLAVSGDEDDDGRAVADEDERLDDLPERAADGVGGCGGRRRLRLELLETRLGARLAEERRHSFDRVGPGRHSVDPGTSRRGTRFA